MAPTVGADQTFDLQKQEKTKPVRVLVWPVPVGVDGEDVGETYDSLKSHKTLLAHLSAVEMTEDAIKDFAHDFGLLTGETECIGDLGNKRVSFKGDPLNLWKNEIVDARMATNLWSAAENGDSEALAKSIKWSPDRSIVKLVWKDGKQQRGDIIAASKMNAYLLSYFEPGDLILPPQIAVLRMINRKLEKYVSPAVLWGGPERAFNIHLSPKHLLGAADRVGSPSLISGPIRLPDGESQSIGASKAARLTPRESFGG